MKKLIFSVLFAGISLVSFAQHITFGVKGGVNFATFSPSGLQNNVVPGTYLMNSPGSVTLFNAGIFTDIKWGHISLQPAINFTGKGGTFQGFTGPFPNGSGGTSVSSIKSNYKIYYLQLPLNVVYHIPVKVGDIYFGAGLYAAVGLSGKVKLTGSNTQTGALSMGNDIKFGENAGNIKSNDYGTDAIAGIKLKNGFLLNINYDLGLSNILPKADGNKFKTRVLGLSVGYAF